MPNALLRQQFETIWIRFETGKQLKAWRSQSSRQNSSKLSRTRDWEGSQIKLSEIQIEKLRNRNFSCRPSTRACITHVKPKQIHSRVNKNSDREINEWRRHFFPNRRDWKSFAARARENASQLRVLQRLQLQPTLWLKPQLDLHEFVFGEFYEAIFFDL